MSSLPSRLVSPVVTRPPGGGVRSMRGPSTGRHVLSRQAAPDPDTLHPALWRADQLGHEAGSVLPSGFAALDAQLPGGGWPSRQLTELLLPHAGVGEVRLLAPCLVSLLREDRPVMLFDPPAGLSGAALAGLGIDASRLLVVYTRRLPLQGAPADGSVVAPPVATARALKGAESHVEPGGDPLWALEQALRSGHVGGLLAWLPPRLSPQRLRRLQFAAQLHPGPAFMLREAAAVERPSAAPLRLGLSSAGIDRLSVRLLKRRGPPLARVLTLGLPPVLPACVVAAVTTRELLRTAASARRGDLPAARPSSAPPAVPPQAVPA